MTASRAARTEDDLNKLVARLMVLRLCGSTVSLARPRRAPQMGCVTSRCPPARFGSAAARGAQENGPCDWPLAGPSISLMVDAAYGREVGWAIATGRSVYWRVEEWGLGCRRRSACARHRQRGRTRLSPGLQVTGTVADGSISARSGPWRRLRRMCADAHAAALLREGSDGGAGRFMRIAPGRRR